MANMLGRRTVYIATIAGALALVAGFAMAAAFTSTSVSSGQNAFSASFGNTAWGAATGTLSPGYASGSSCAGTPTSSASTSITTSLGTAGTGTAILGLNGTCNANDFTEEWTFTMTETSAVTSVTDTFTVYAIWGGATPYTTYSEHVADAVTLAVSGSSGTSTITLNLIVDFGTNPAPGGIDGLNVVVTGPVA